MTLIDSLYFKDSTAKEEGHAVISCGEYTKTKGVFSLRERSQTR